MRLAQTAALEGRDAVALDEDLIQALEGTPADAVRLPPHLEVGVRIHAEEATALEEVALITRMRLDGLVSA